MQADWIRVDLFSDPNERLHEGRTNLGAGQPADLHQTADRQCVRRGCYVIALRKPCMKGRRIASGFGASVAA